jgi:type II secretory pathway pseudopilin PulG
VIIGVLASLAIPRFTEASDKAKVAEAPRVLASYESAQLAKLAESNVYGSTGDIIFDIEVVNSDSKWFAYAGNSGGTNGTTATGQAQVTANGIGKITGGGIISTLASDGTITHTSIGGTPAQITRYLPNWFKATTTGSTGG